MNSPEDFLTKTVMSSSDGHASGRSRSLRRFAIAVNFSVKYNRISPPMEVGSTSYNRKTCVDLAKAPDAIASPFFETLSLWMK